MKRNGELNSRQTLVAQIHAKSKGPTTGFKKGPMGSDYGTGAYSSSRPAPATGVGPLFCVSSNVGSYSTLRTNARRGTTVGCDSREQSSRVQVAKLLLIRLRDFGRCESLIHRFRDGSHKITAGCSGFRQFSQGQADQRLKPQWVPARPRPRSKQKC
jgi:hypothetical protein